MIAILLSYTVTSREVAKQIPFQSVMLTEKEKIECPQRSNLL